MPKFKYKKQPGFTLIELMIVVVIMLILSTIVAIFVGGVTRSARDAQRKTDLDYMRKLLSVYYMDHGFFPTHQTAGISPLSCVITLYPSPECQGLLDELKVYSPKIPFDPNDKYLRKGDNYCENNSCYHYTTPDPAHSVSCICANLEEADSASTPPICQNTEKNYCLQLSF